MVLVLMVLVLVETKQTITNKPRLANAAPLAAEIAVRLQSPRSSSLSSSPSTQFKNCHKHVDKIEYYFCVTHRQLMCELCRIDEHSSSNCCVKAFVDVESFFKDELKKDLTHLQVCITLHCIALHCCRGR